MLFSILLNQLDLPDLPALVEVRLQRTVDTQEREPALAGHGLNPVALLTRRRFGPEVDVVRTVAVGDRSRCGIRLASGPGEALRCSQHGTSLVIVHRE